jgi:pimeloyl-ACP methyl ester carboxylesterase
LIDVGGHRLHFHASGSGPVVVFDAALGGSSISWTPVQPEVARFARACTYDRAGFGWSDAGPMPRTAGRIADELRVLLDRSGEPPPYILVGHSFGGLVTRIFAKRYPDVTGGLVLVEAAQPEDWTNPGGTELDKLLRGAALCRHGARAARLGIAHVVSALVGAGALRPAFALARLFSRGDLKAHDQWILGPLMKLPPEVRHPLRQFWTERKFFEALGSQIETIRTSAQETLDAAKGGYGDLPLITISQTDPGDHRLRQQTALAASSTRGRHIIAPNSGHWVPLDEPALVVDAVRDVLQAAARLTGTATTARGRIGIRTSIERW